MSNEAHTAINKAMNDYMRKRQKDGGGVPHRDKEYIPVEFCTRKYIVTFYSEFKKIMSPSNTK